MAQDDDLTGPFGTTTMGGRERDEGEIAQRRKRLTKSGLFGIVHHGDEFLLRLSSGIPEPVIIYRAQNTR